MLKRTKFLILSTPYRMGKKVLLFSSNFSKMVKDTKMKLSHLKVNRLANYMKPNL